MMPPFARTALLLDVDGTLLDIAPTPDSVVIPPGLTDTLRALQIALEGALALVTGRSIDVVDGFFDFSLAVAGEHGGAIRHAPGGAVERPDLPTPPASWLTAAAALVAAHPGALLERKARGFALHFRQAPVAGPIFHAALIAMIGAGSGFQVLQGLMLWEVRPVGVDKGSAVSALMADPPFADRVPLFIGDDVTDEDGMRIARAMGGEGLRVAPVFGSPAGVRAWLAKAVAAKEWP